jgi:hypothetical protein
MSGRSNVVFWLESRGLPATDEVVDRIFAAAKASERTLTHEQVETLIGGPVPTKSGTPRLQTVPRRRRGF